MGNLIQSGDQNGGTLLTTIVSVDPMYAYFDMDERTVLRIRQLIREGKAKSAGQTKWPVALGLATEEGFPHQGTINFEDNQVNPKTGTLRVRGVFPNKDEGALPRLFRPRPRAHRSSPPAPCWSLTARSTPTRARRFSTSSTRSTRWSPAPSGWGRSTTACGRSPAGLKPGEQVIVSGLQQVRPGITVEPKLLDMPVRLAANSQQVRKTLKGGRPCWRVSSSTDRSWRG